MKLPLVSAQLPPSAILITCASHEERCRGFLSQMSPWCPLRTVLFHYDDANPRREENCRLMEEALHSAGSDTVSLIFTETNAVKSLHDNMAVLREVLQSAQHATIVLDISVFTKRHLLMMLRWLDDSGWWDRLTVVYSEPEDYDVSEFIPLSFGLASLQQIPGFSACPDFSRPVHLVLFLGYEGDRALAVFEQVQPMDTTLVVAYPPYKPTWVGRTEKFNADLFTLVGGPLPVNVDAGDPEATKQALTTILGDPAKRSTCARVISPLGTKPQTLGIYSFVRECADPPALVYAGPLRHNHDFFSHGIGATWLLKATTVK